MRQARFWSLPGVRRALPLLALLGVPVTLPAQEGGATAAAVFERFSPRVVKIEIVETASGAKAVVGSGFFVTDRGHLVTNYHVVSKVIQDPERYEAKALEENGSTFPLTVVALDVVHDLAVARADVASPSHFALHAVTVEKGVRLYSLGHPLELGLSIVEGTYNGLLEHTRYTRIHFTAPINPGMSGGPTITADGRVVGINVATAGNEVSFLVPVARAVVLLDRALAPSYRVPSDFLTTVREQLLAHQDDYLAGLFIDTVATIEFGPYRVPTKPAPFFNCWGDATHDPADPYEVLDHQCSTDDYIFISSDMESGVVELWHRLLTSDELNRFRFYALFSDDFDQRNAWLQGSEDDVTPFRCDRSTVAGHGVTLKVQFCARRYRKLEGLYDAVIRAAAVGRPDVGLESVLTLSGVSFDNAQRLLRRYLEAIRWNR